MINIIAGVELIIYSERHCLGGYCDPIKVLLLG